MELFARLKRYVLHHQVLAVIMLLGVLTIIGYANTISAPFVFDDTGVFGEQGVMLSFTGFLSVWNYFPARFLPYATFLLNYWVGGVNPVGYHLVDLLLHWATAVAVYWLVGLFGRSPNEKSHPWLKSRWTALAAAALFTVHPIETQAVTYVYQRSTEMAALFFLLSLCFLLRRSWKISIACAIGGFFSKENSYVLPLVAFLTMAMFDPAALRKKQGMGYLLVLVALTVAGLLLIGNHTYQDRPGKGVAYLLNINSRTEATYGAQYFLTQINVIATYLRLLVVPVGQNIDYDYPIVHSLSEFPYQALLLHVAIVLSAVFLARRNRLILYGVLFFYITLAVESSFIPLDDVIFEHRLYLPSVGLFLAGVTVVDMMVRAVPIRNGRRIALPVLGVTLVGILLMLTVRRNTLWRDPALLWEDSVAKSPKKPRPHYNLAVIYDRSDQLEPALKEYKETLLIQPKRAEALINMGVVLTRMGRLKDAEKAYVLADAVDPTSDALPLLNLGTLYMQENNMDMARLAFEELVKRQPKHPFALYNLGLVYESLDRREEATQMYQKALTAAAGNPAQLQVIEERERNRQAWYEYQKVQQQSRQQAPGVVLPPPPQQDQ